MESVQITFDCGGTDDEWPFLREYLVPAWDRFETDESFHSGWFWRAGGFARHDLGELTREEHDLERLEPGQVIVVLNGEPESLLAAERPRWESLRSDGLLADWAVRWFHPTWEHSHAKLDEKYGAVGGRRAATLRPMATALIREYVDAFEEPLPAVDESTAENEAAIGFWVLFHYLSKHAGYDWYDEIDACTKAIENRIASLAVFADEDEARRTLEATIADLEEALASYESG